MKSTSVSQGPQGPDAPPIPLKQTYIATSTGRGYARETFALVAGETSLICHGHELGNKWYLKVRLETNAIKKLCAHPGYVSVTSTV